MSLNDPNPQQEQQAEEPSFADILNEFESVTAAQKAAAAKATPKGKGRNRNAGRPSRPASRGTVVGITSDAVLIDYGAKSEGVIPRANLLDAEGNVSVKVGDLLEVTVTGFNPDGTAKLSRIAGVRIVDWDDLQRAFDAKDIVAGRVTGVVKGGLTVDIGTRAFLPASRSGAREMSDMEKLVGQEIRGRIVKLDIEDEDVVIDRRSVVEEEAAQIRQGLLETIEAGAVVRGTVRSLATYGAFVDIGGIDGLLHVGDISWSRVSDPASELSVGDTLDLKILKADKNSGKISLGLKQMTPDPWEQAMATLKAGDRLNGDVVRLTDFGAFVEVSPGVEGLIHVSEMSWTKRIKRPSDILKVGERVEAEVLKVDKENGKLSLGLKQVLGNPWDTIGERYPNGKIIEGKVTRFASFGAFIEIEEGIDGLVHISEFTSEKRIQSASEVVKLGQVVRSVVVSSDPKTRRLKLSVKALEATPTDKFAEDVAVGDRVTGRILKVRSSEVLVQLGEGVEGTCAISKEAAPQAAAPASTGSLAEQLAAAWKGSAKPTTTGGPEAYREGQLRSFTVKSLDVASRRIELTPAS